VVGVFELVSLAFLASTAHMVGEFLREVAVLLMVFVPLELWKQQGGTVNYQLMAYVTGASLLIFVFGMFLEWMHLLLCRVKRNLEASHATK
jgi:hypothetical protein